MIRNIVFSLAFKAVLCGTILMSGIAQIAQIYKIDIAEVKIIFFANYIVCLVGFLP